jgi:DNA polymerase-1
MASPEDATRADHDRAAARGRFARNAVIQGSAAEFFKMWALVVRHAIEPLGARIVLCLHDELLIHTPEDSAAGVAEAVHHALTTAAAAYLGADVVRFVADVSIVRSWAEAKG